MQNIPETRLKWISDPVELQSDWQAVPTEYSMSSRQSIAFSAVVAPSAISLLHSSWHRRAGLHPFGGQTEFCPIRWGGVVADILRDPYSVGVVAEIFRDPCTVGGGVSSTTFRVIQTCIVVCPNNVDSLPALMSTNSPNWGGGNCPRPVRLWWLGRLGSWIFLRSCCQPSHWN